MNAKNLTIAALLLASLTLTAAAQSAPNQEPSLNPNARGLQLSVAGAQQVNGNFYVANTGDRVTLEASASQAAKVEIKAKAIDDDGAEVTLKAEFLPLGGKMSWSARIPDSLAARTVEFQAVARTLSGQTLSSTKFMMHFRQASRPEPKDDDQGSNPRPPGLGGNVR